MDKKSALFGICIVFFIALAFNSLAFDVTGFVYNGTGYLNGINVSVYNSTYDYMGSNITYNDGVQDGYFNVSLGTIANGIYNVSFSDPSGAHKNTTNYPSVFMNAMGKYLINMTMLP